MNKVVLAQVFASRFFLFSFVGCLALVNHDVQTLSAQQAVPKSSVAEKQGDLGESTELKQERLTADRFLLLLKKNPRTGTALDKVYGFHVGQGTLNQFSENLKTEATRDKNGACWLILGMVQMQRGQDAEAIISLEQAELLLKESAIPPYYLGKSLVLTGEIEKATQAFERAITKKPARTDLLQIFQDLGRVYQRTGRNEEALAIWKRLEELFPGDYQVQEEIARILVEEGGLKEALLRFDQLAKSHKDKARQIEMAIQAAQIRAQLGEQERAIQEFEKQLAIVNPGTWLHRDIRRRIEEVFYSSSDYDGMITYYTKWVQNNPDDIDAMMRVARVLSVQKRMPEAREWFNKAISKAPSEPEPRLALVEALVREDDVATAADEMGKLVAAAPQNPDYIIRWGDLTFENPKAVKADKQKQAKDIWQKLLVDHEKDAVTIARFADMLRKIELTDDALIQYQAAMNLAPNEPQYREYLGEFYFQLNRKDEALTTWKSIAEGDRKNRDNLVRLSEIYSTFQYGELALASMAEACQMNPTFGHRMRYAELLMQDRKYEESLKEIAEAGKIAEDAPSRALVLEMLIQNYQNSGKLTEKLSAQEELVRQEQGAKDPQAWKLLALLYQSIREFQRACVAIEQACQFAPDDAMIWTTAAKLHEQAGRFGDTIADYRKLAMIDRRFLSEYLTQIANLEMRLGRVEEALKTGEELLSAGAGKAEHFEFYSGLFFQAGDANKGLEILRRGVRANPNHRESILHLAKTLADEFQTDEAIEYYWRAFDLKKGVDDRREVVTQLTDLYVRTNRFEKLLDRLEIIGREENKPRDSILLTAEAHLAAGDLGMARRLLEQLIRQETRDTELLEQLVKLSKSEYDMETAVEYQKRLVQIAPSPQTEYQLATMLVEIGEVSQSEALWQKLASRTTKTSEIIKVCDTLLEKGEANTAVTIVERSMRLNPADWELKSLAMVVYMRAQKKEEALKVAKEVATMKVSPETLTETVKQFIEREKLKKKPDQNSSGMLSYYNSIKNRSFGLSSLNQIKTSLLGTNTDYYNSYRQPIYSPNCFRDVLSVATLVELYSQKEQDKVSEYIKEYLQKIKTSSNAEELWRGVFYLHLENPSISYQVTPVKDEYYACLDNLIALKELDAVSLKISSIINSYVNYARNSADEQPKPLEEATIAELEKLISSCESNSQEMQYYWLQLSNIFRQTGKVNKADEFLDKYLQKMKSPEQLLETSITLISIASDKKKPNEALLERGLKMFQEALAKSETTILNSRQWTYSIPQVLYNVSQNMSSEKSLVVLDHLLNFQARSTASLRPSQLSKWEAFMSQNSNYIYINNQYTQLNLTYPPSSGYFNDTSIKILRSFYEVCKDQPLKLQSLKEFLQQKIKADENDRYRTIANLFALSSIYHWTEDKKGVLESLTQLSSLGIEPGMIELSKARILYEMGQSAAALTLVEGLTPLNQQMLVDRELTILQLVLEKGDLDRARRSAQKLFALKLKPEIEFELADLMYQLRMVDYAERMMSRIRRRSGGSQETLLKMMNHYATANQNEAAAEVALQVLRRTKPPRSANFRTTEDMQHEQALNLLAKTNQLQPLIEKTEKQLERSPKSIKLIESLASYYRAAGKRDLADKIMAKAIEQGSSVDPQFLIQAGQQLARSGKHAEAVTKYLQAIEKNPDSFGNDFYSMSDSFENTKQYDKLVELILKVGIQKFSNSYYRFSEITRPMMQHNQGEALNKLVLAIFKSGNWNMFSQVSNVFNNTQFKPSPEMIDTIRNQLFDRKTMLNSTYQYSVNSYGQNGKIEIGIFEPIRLICKDVQSKQELLKLTEEILQDKPEVLLPRIVQIAILLEDKKISEITESVKYLQERKTKTTSDWLLLWALAGKISDIPEGQSLAINILEPMVKLSENELGIYGLSLQHSHLGLLCHIYEKDKQHVRAKEMILEQLNILKIDNRNPGNQGYGEYQYVNSYISLLNGLIQVDSPAEASLYLKRLSQNRKLIESANAWNGAGYYENQLATLKTKIESKLTADKLLLLIDQIVGETASQQTKTQNEQKMNVLSEMMSQPEIIKQSIVKTEVTFVLAEFLKAANKNEKLQSDLRAKYAGLELGKSRNIRELVSTTLILKAANQGKLNPELVQQLQGWLKSHPYSRGSEEKLDLPSKKEQELDEELLLAVLVTTQKESDLPRELKLDLLKRASDAAKRSNQAELVASLQCLVAEEYAKEEPAKAKEILMNNLNLILPDVNQ